MPALIADNRYLLPGRWPSKFLCLTDILKSSHQEEIALSRSQFMGGLVSSLVLIRERIYAGGGVGYHINVMAGESQLNILRTNFIK